MTAFASRCGPSLQVKFIEEQFHGFVESMGLKFPDVAYVMNG